MHWSPSPFSMSASYGARHFSHQSPYSREQKKNPCSHRTSFLVCFYSEFPPTPRVVMLGTFLPAVKLSRPCIYSSRVNKNLTLYSSHSISLDHVRRSWPGSALEPFRQEVRKLSLGTGDKKGAACPGGCTLCPQCPFLPGNSLSFTQGWWTENGIGGGSWDRLPRFR